MKLLKVAIVALLAFVLGVWSSRLKTVNASSQDAGQAHVFIAPLEMLDAKAPRTVNLPGVKIVGISCVAKPTERLPDAAVCYVATTLENGK